MRLEHYSDMRAYQTAFRTKMTECRSFNLGIAMTDQDGLYLFNKNLPPAWKPLILASSASSHNFDDSLKFFVNQAKVDPLLPGTLKRTSAAAPDRVHVLNQILRKPLSLMTHVRSAETTLQANADAAPAGANTDTSLGREGATMTAAPSVTTVASPATSPSSATDESAKRRRSDKTLRM